MTQRIFVALLCALLATQQITAVVNNGQSTAVETDASSTKSSETSSSLSNVADSLAASSEKEANRRDAPIGDAYGPPVVPHEVYGPPADTYIPSLNNNPGLPLPAYGVPDGSSNNLIYPGPPPDIPQALPSIPSFAPPKDSYGPPKDIYGPPKDTYGPPKDIYGPPRDSYGPPKPIYGPPPPKYGPPSFPKLPRPNHPPPFYKPKPVYGPPRPQYGPPHSAKPFFKPKFNYGPPKPQYGPPKPSYGPPKPIYGPPKHHGHPPKFYGPPRDVYGPPKPHYGPPDPIPHGPPHPGVPAPPTPPDIKYDGWQPIPGLVSRPPSDSYGVPQGEPHNLGDLQFNNDFVPPPAIGHGLSSLSLGSSYGSSVGISDSYGAPLNTVTGSGGIVSTSGDAHIHNQDQSAFSLGLSAAGIGGGHNGQLSVIKSIGYEILPNGGHNNVVSGDSYLAPPSSSYSVNGPYAASHSYKNHAVSSSFASSNNYHAGFGKGLSHSSSSGVSGLIPPNGLYGVPSNGQYGTPLLSEGNRFPVEHGSGGFNGPSYIPPSNDLKSPSSLYSLPNPQSQVQFFKQTDNSHSFGGGQSLAFTSYNAPVGAIDGAYGAPNQGGGLDYSHFGQNIDFGHGIPHDCTAYKSQPLPQLSYGVPSANTYTASLSSMKTNIGGQYPSLAYGTPDLQAAHSVNSGASVNAIDDNNKGVVDSLAPGGELIKSESIDFNNIPLQGALGSYTLQIQPADGAAGTASSSLQVPHDQVLNDGLLQSILAAIEQPQKNGQVHVTNGQVQGHLSENLELPFLESMPHFNKQVDDEAQHSIKEQIVIAPPSTEATVERQTEAEKADQDAGPIQLIDNNEIALYFHNNHQAQNDKQDKHKEESIEAEMKHPQQQQQQQQEEMKETEDVALRVGKQGGSYVSFKTPSTSYVYGDIKSEIADEQK